MLCTCFQKECNFYIALGSGVCGCAHTTPQEFVRQAPEAHYQCFALELCIALQCLTSLHRIVVVEQVNSICSGRIVQS